DSKTLRKLKMNKDLLCDEGSPESVEKYKNLIKKIGEIIELCKIAFFRMY
ncbi:hypothetical protein NEIRO03_2244, partial [Nematocida sp. AWRm78]